MVTSLHRLTRGLEFELWECSLPLGQHFTLKWRPRCGSGLVWARWVPRDIGAGPGYRIKNSKKKYNPHIWPVATTSPHVHFLYKFFWVFFLSIKVVAKYSLIFLHRNIAFSTKKVVLRMEQSKVERQLLPTQFIFNILFDFNLRLLGVFLAHKPIVTSCNRLSSKLDS